MRTRVTLVAAWAAAAGASGVLGLLALTVLDQPFAGALDAGVGRVDPVSRPAGGLVMGAGVVTARCLGETAFAAGTPHDDGWVVGTSPDPGAVVFHDDVQQVVVRVSCTGGRPVYRMEGPVALPVPGG